MSDAFDLDRFVAAQDRIWPAPLTEIASGRKTSHWMWFVFPQIDGLGHSAMARHYAIRSLAEARAYLAHPLLRGRLDAAIAALDASAARSAEAVFGALDAAKLRSSLTLFAAAGGGAPFAAAIDRWFAGVGDDATTALLARMGDARRR